MHNTDDDSLILLLITDFRTFKIKEIKLSLIEDSIWEMIYHRFGANNQLIVMKVNTLFSSYEFSLFLQMIYDGTVYVPGATSETTTEEIALS